MQPRTQILAGVIGSGLEWYDFALYGSFAEIIAKLFFPATNHLNSLLATFGIFALGFFARPLGGLIFGHFGDRIGRTKVLVFTVFGMTLPTIIIGVLPSYEKIGIAAPLLLLAARLIQGLIIGGEYTGALLFLAENEASHRRGLTGSFTMMSALGGLLLGSLVAALLTSFVNKEAVYAWAWRIPFLLAGILGFIGYHLRRFMSESQAFLELQKKALLVEKPAIVAFRDHRDFMLLAIGLCVMTGTAQYLMFAFFPSFIQHHTQLPLSTVLRINTFGMLIMLIAIPFFARLSDKVGRRPILLAAAIGFLVCSLPIFYALSQPNILFVVLGVTCFGFLIAIASAPMAALYIELFPAPIRYSGIAISYNIAFAIFAGTAPAIATMLVNSLHSALAPVLLVVAASLISLSCYYAMPETAGKDI